MKKLPLIGAVLVPVLFFSACAVGAGGLTFTANWYANTDNPNLSNAEEFLEYDVSFEQENADASFRVNYENGVYTTDLREENIPSAFAEGSPLGYHYKTELKLDGKFFLGDAATDPFTDTVVSDVYFLTIGDALRPVHSEKRVVCHAPVAGMKNVEDSFLLYDYTLTTDYSPELNRATVVYKQNLPAENGEPKTETKELKLKGGGTFLDNEQILFALRGLNIEDSFSFRTINPVDRKAATVTVSDIVSAETAYTYQIGDAEKKEYSLTAAKVTLSYTGTYRGREQTLLYAKQANSASNLHRNVLLRMEVPVLDQLGTLVYTLKKANFMNK